MNLQISRVHEPVTVLGYGTRVGVWTQGCSIGCKGCVSRDTWPTAGGFALAVADLVEIVGDAADRGLDGLTISGGEPFEQPDALHDLLFGIRESLNRSRQFDVLAYTGRTYDSILRDHAPILNLLDAVIPEPYRASDGPGGIWRGSTNQPILPLSDLGRERYGVIPAATDRRSMQVSVENGQVWMVGIPGPGDLHRVSQLVANAGVALDEVSWLP